MESLLGKNIDELQDVAVAAGLPRFTGKQLAEWLYRKRAESFEEMTNISAKGRQTLANGFVTGRTKPVAEVKSEDGTRKLLFQVGTEYVETVLSGCIAPAEVYYCVTKPEFEIYDDSLSDLKDKLFVVYATRYPDSICLEYYMVVIEK